jgi:hypothetical protein
MMVGRMVKTTNFCPLYSGSLDADDPLDEIPPIYDSGDSSDGISSSNRVSATVVSIVSSLTIGGPYAPSPLTTPTKPLPGLDPPAQYPQLETGTIHCANQTDNLETWKYYDSLATDACVNFQSVISEIASGQTYFYTGIFNGTFPIFYTYPSTVVRIYVINNCRFSITEDYCSRILGEVINFCSSGSISSGGYFQDNCVAFYIGADTLEGIYPSGQVYAAPNILLELPPADN